MRSCEMGTGGTKRTVSCFWKLRIRTENSDGYNSFPVLRDAKVRGVHLSHVNSIPSINQWREQVKDKAATRSRQEPLNVLKYKSHRAPCSDDSAEDTNERIAGVPVSTQSC